MAARRVLIVDDDASFRSLTRALISNGEYKVVAEARDGEEAVQLVEKLQPDVVLMDVSMPNRDGLSAAADIEARWPAIRVVFMTGTQSAEKLERLQARGYVSKAADDLRMALMARLTAAS